MKKLLMVSLIVLLVVGLVSPCVAAPKGTLLVASATFSYESTDPIFWESFWGMAMYDPLLSFDPEGNIIGVVAKSWELSPDGLTWTFHIRKGIKFHNGDDLTAEDVAWTIKRFSSKESTNPWSPYLRNTIVSCEATDKYTVEYKANRPEPPLVVPFAWTRILPKKYFESVGQDEFRKHPIGSGSFKFEKLVPKTSMEMVAVQGHWRQEPAFEKVIDIMVPEESTRVAMLKRGDVDICAGLSFDRIAELDKAGFKLQEAGLPTVANISFQGTWLTKGPTKEKKFRQAMSYAINRQELSDTFYQGYARPGGRWFMVEGSWGWDPNWKADPYDPEKAKALMKEVGYPEKYGDNAVVNIFTQKETADLMQALAGYWEEIGIFTKITITDPMTQGGYFFVRAKDANAPNIGGIIPWQWPSFFSNVYHSANMFKSTGVHTTGNDPKADAMYDAATAELDMDKAKKMWTDFMNYTYDMWVNVGLIQAPSYLVCGPKVGEFTGNAHMGLYDAYAFIQHAK